MPTEPRGFFFTHVEKIVFGVVAAGFLVVAYFAFQRAAISQEEDPLVSIQQYEQQVKGKIDKEAPPPEPVDYYELVQNRYEEIAEPPTMPRWVMWPSRPRVYATIRVGFNQSYQITFDAAVRKETVRIEGAPVGEEVIKVKPPVGPDYKTVILETGKLEDRDTLEFNIVAQATDRRHIQPVVMDAEVKGPAAPPLNFAVVGLPGEVEIQLEPNPQNKSLEVRAYLLYRRKVSDVTAEWRELGAIPAGREFEQTEEEGEEGTAEGERERRRQFGPTGERLMGPGGGPMFGPGSEEGLPPGMSGEGIREFGGPPRGQREIVDRYLRIDTNVEPGAVYQYRIRTRALKSHPPLSEFTEAKQVKVPPTVDFRFTGSIPGGVRVEVIRRTGRDSVRTAEFDVAIGEQIGGMLERGVSPGSANFLTPYYLVDYHPRASKEVQVEREVGGRKVTRTRTKFARILYAEPNGNLRVRWRKEGDSELWDWLEGGRPRRGASESEEGG